MMKVYLTKNVFTRSTVKRICILTAAAGLLELSTSFTAGTEKVAGSNDDADSLPRVVISSLYLENYSRDTLMLGRAGLKPWEVPSFPESVYSSRIKALKSTIPLAYNKYVRDYINLYLFRKRCLASKIIGRSYDYFPLFEETLKKNSMPLELKNLAIVESALSCDAVSWCGATGMWQFMPSTAKIYKLRIDSVMDERKDPVRSTEAAARYLKDLHRVYKDWLLAIAAYNCGPGNVNKAMRKARRGTRKKVDFWAIKRYLPAETQGYVPAFIASCYMMKHYYDHNLKAIEPGYLTSGVQPVELKSSTTFEEISRRLKITPEELSYFNPSYEKTGSVAVTDTIVPLLLPVNLHRDFYKLEEDIYRASSARFAGKEQTSGARN
jgi:membrane-bound lytic murein transglycosylase D